MIYTNTVTFTHLNYVHTTRHSKVYVLKQNHWGTECVPYLSVDLSVCLSVCFSLLVSVCLSVCFSLFVCLSVCFSQFVSVCMSVCSLWKRLCRNTHNTPVAILHKRWRYPRHPRTNLQMYVSSYYIYIYIYIYIYLFNNIMHYVLSL